MLQQELDAAIAGWRTAADEGFASAQYSLGRLFYDGYGVAETDKEAVLWFTKAAEQGHVNAQLFLLMSLRGRGMRHGKQRQEGGTVARKGS